MKTAKLVLGILSICISVFVLFQSFAAGMANALSSNGEVGGTGGALVAILMLTAGIVMIATRKSDKKGGSVAAMILYLIAAFFGFVTAGSYSDLKVWSSICLILAVVNLIALIKVKKQIKAEKAEREAFENGGQTQ